MASRTFLLLALAFAVFLLITSEVAAAKELASNTDIALMVQVRLTIVDMENTKAVVDMEDTKAVVDVEDMITVQDVEPTTMVEEEEDSSMILDVEGLKVADMAVVVVDVPTKTKGACVVAHLKRQPLTSKLKTS
ncbi:hypothetical protein LXL04_038046 [Taraxacum kok-saghyz]